MNPSLPNPKTGRTAIRIGLIALTIQLVGLGAAILTDFDNQGAVGKALVALLTQLIAIPTALLGLLVSLIDRWRYQYFSKSLALGLIASLAGLIPLALIYVKLVR
jgi:hypothetical protein